MPRIGSRRSPLRRVIHTIDRWLADYRTDLYSLGLCHALSAEQKAQLGLHRDHERLRAMRQDWRALHLPGVPTFMLAASGQTEGAGPFPGLLMTPRAAFSARHKDGSGVSLDPRVPMVCVRYWM